MKLRPQIHVKMTMEACERRAVHYGRQRRACMRAAEVALRFFVAVSGDSRQHQGGEVDQSMAFARTD